MSPEDQLPRPSQVVYRIEEVADRCGIQSTVIVSFIEREWLRPAAAAPALALDAEDIARAHLIRELREDLGVNDEAVPIILDLLDQLHYLRSVHRRGTRTA